MPAINCSACGVGPCQAVFPLENYCPRTMALSPPRVLRDLREEVRAYWAATVPNRLFGTTINENGEAV